MTQVAATFIFLATIATVIVRPPRVPEWLAAAAGATLMIVVGVEPAREALRELVSQWNVLLFFAGLTIVVAVAESAGFFAWVAHLVASGARGSGRRLFFGVIAAAALVTLFLTNDAAVVVMTPLVFVLVRRLRLPAAPFAFASTFIANGASILLPISNPINFIIGSAAGLRLGDYVAMLWAPAIGGAITTIVMLWAYFHRDIRVRFDISSLNRLEEDARYRTEVTALLAATACAMLATSALESPVGLTAAVAGAVMLAHGFLRGRLRLRHIVDEMNPGIVVMVAALFVVVDGVRHAGLLGPAAALVVAAARAHPALAAPFAALVTAAASNVFNNVPTALIAVGTLHVGLLDPEVTRHFAAGAIVGCDLGPNLTTVGSLSTLIWLVLLRRRGLHISVAEYCKVGILLAPASLACAITMLWLANR